jgi:hypothetical protein
MTNDTDLDSTRFLRSAFAVRAPDEVLRAPPGALMGVSAAAEAALATLDIHSVFDLAASRVFAAAAALTAIETDPAAVEARLNVVASDVAVMPPGMPVRELASQPIGILQGIDAGAAAALAAALDVATVRELALWPPYSAARAILSAAFFPEKAPGFDPDAPADLRPKSGVYPTERVFFRKLVFDAVSNAGEAVVPIETSDAIDLTAALGAQAGFTRLATGALLSFSQSWFAQGLTLGQLLHSVTLAPGESTRIACIDWSRRSRAGTSEDISESELLSNTMLHSRAVSEVTRATANEFQSGTSSVTSTSSTEQGGAALGFELGPISFGGSAAGSSTTTEVMSASSSFGARDLAASYAQDINDRSQQNASSVRNRRASIVREVSQSEHEEISTRVLTNYNHMHALSIHYYEVVQAFRTTTQLERAEKCLFVPVKLMDFRDPTLVDRWRLRLADAALTERARRQLTAEYGVVELIPQTPRIRPGRPVVTGATGGVLGGAVVASLTRFATAASAVTTGAGGAPGSPADTGAAAAGTAAPGTTSSGAGAPGTTAPGTAPPGAGAEAAATNYLRAPANAPAALLALKGWNLDQLNSIGWTSGRVLMRAGSDSVFVSDDALVVGFSLREGQAGRFVVRLHNGSEITPAAATPSAFTFSEPASIAEVESIAVQFAGTADLATSLILQLNILGTIMPLDVPVVLRPMSVPHEVLKFGRVSAARELMDHLMANRLYYTQAILRSLDAATVGAILARFTYRGLPLGMLVDAQPVAVTANFLVFKMNVADGSQPDDPRWVEEQAAWETWLKRHGLDRPAPTTEIIPLPSGGMFAESVLGRYNSAERTDLTRFWNWQDSPIPIVAPDIAPVQSGSRAQAEDLKPGQLSSPVLSIQSPTALPDPTGIASIINAVQNGNMFRDMSGLAQSAALAQAALQASGQGATAAGSQAAQTLATVMANNTERLRIAAAVATGGASALGGAGGLGGRPAGNITEEGARYNYARELDARAGGADNGAAASASGGAGGSGEASDSSGGGGGAIEVPSPVVAGSQETLPVSYERATFNRETGGAAEDLVKQAFDFGDANGGGGGRAGAGRGRGSGTKAAQKFRVVAKFLTHTGGDPFTAGDITMVVYDVVKDAPGAVLWRPGFVSGHGTKYLFAPSVKSTIESAPISVSGDQVLVELRIRLFQVEHDINPSTSVVYFGTAAIFDTPGTGTLKVDADVETTEFGYTVQAADRNAAIAAAEQQRGQELTAEQNRLSSIRSVRDLGNGNFRVLFDVLTKNVLILHPQAIKVYY